MPILMIPVRLDAKTFSRFAIYDALRLKKHWRSPALFLMIMLGFAAVAYTQHGRIDGAALLGTVLLAVGLLMPLGYCIRFYQSIRAQIKKAGLDTPKAVYTLTLTDGEIQVITPDGQEAAYKWDYIHGVYRDRSCAYLYVTPRHAFLLPDAAMGTNRDLFWQLAERYGKARVG